MKRTAKRPTRAFIDEVSKYVKSGCPVETAFRITLGSRWELGFEWMAVGAGETRPELLRRKPYRDLLDAVVKSEAEAEARHARIVQKSRSEKWSAWWLSRRVPSRWSATERSAVTVTVPHRLRSGQIVEMPADLAVALKKLRDEPYQDPRQLPKGDAEPAEPSVIVEDVIEVRPGGDRPPKDDPEDVEGRPPATLPEVIKRPLVD